MIVSACAVAPTSDSQDDEATDVPFAPAVGLDELSDQPHPVLVDAAIAPPVLQTDAGWQPPPYREPELPKSDATVRVDGMCRPLAQVRDATFRSAERPDALVLPEAKAAAMVGTWVGYAAAPQGWIPSRWLIELTLRGDGSYAADAVDGHGAVPPLYYGTIKHSDMHQWELTAAHRDRVSHLGKIDVPFDYGKNLGLPAWLGELSGVELDRNGERLRFDFKTSGGYGPVHYELFRPCE